MKKQNLSALFNVVKQSLFSIGFTGFLLIGLVTGASAQSSDNAPKAAINYIGSLDGKPVFKVDLDNKNGNVYFLSIKDDEGALLYSEKIKDKQFSKSFRFDADRDVVKLSFILSTGKETQTQEFKVNTSTRSYNDVAVTTL
jgi:hypothetical protein